MAETVPNILVVDDIKANIDILVEILGDEYDVSVAMDGTSALIYIDKEPPDLVLLDIMMPGMSGYEVCERLKSNPDTRNIPVIFVTAMGEITDETKGFDLGAVDYITKPISPPIVMARVHTHLALYDQNRELEKKVQQRTVELNATRLEIIRRLGTAAEFKDKETGMHVVRMSYYSHLISKSAGLGEERSELILNAAPMHDIGKIGIPDNILLKPGKLDCDEWEIMKKHTTIGVEILGSQKSELMAIARIIAISHHEKWNGKGYPHGLSGNDIPLEGQVVSIADVFDALTSTRPYKKAWSDDEAIQVIHEERNQQFNPDLVDAFMDTLPEILAIKKQYTDE